MCFRLLLFYLKMGPESVLENKKKWGAITLLIFGTLSGVMSAVVTIMEYVSEENAPVVVLVVSVVNSVVVVVGVVLGKFCHMDKREFWIFFDGECDFLVSRAKESFGLSRAKESPCGMTFEK
jgi:hypothetical protein